MRTWAYRTKLCEPGKIGHWLIVFDQDGWEVLSVAAYRDGTQAATEDNKFLIVARRPYA